jgi:hypothetical protein
MWFPNKVVCIPRFNQCKFVWLLDLIYSYLNFYFSQITAATLLQKWPKKIAFW